MNPNELLLFLVPQPDPLHLQYVFGGIILLMMVVTIVMTHIYARESSWEKKWNNGTPDDRTDDLDIDHGSVTDLWHAVATAPEKLAELMPGMLLVIGLLGTFLGLGLALNHSANILDQSNDLSALSAANSMQDIMGMMQGLGTKFKTSTWGIIGFLFLKVWSSLARFDEKRLTWVIRKVKTELVHRKIEERKLEDSKQQVFFEQINLAAEKIVQGYALNLEQFMEKHTLLHQSTLLHADKSVQLLQQDLTSIHTTLQCESIAMQHAVEKSTQGIREELMNMNTSAQASSKSIGELVKHGSQGIIKELQIVKNSVEPIQQNLTDIRAALQSESVAMRQLMEQSTQDIHKELVEINGATQASSKAMSDFVTSTQTIVKDMSAASSKMVEGALAVGEAGNGLVKAVDDFRSQFTAVLSEVQVNLSNAINNMSEQAAQTLEQGTAELGKATREISSALGVLSKDVTTTMSGVTDSIEKSLKIQQDGAIRFRTSSDTLNENVAATTELVKKLGGDITSGLKAVSDSGRRMNSIGNSLEQIVPKIADLMPALEPLKTLTSQLENILTETQALRKDSNTATQHSTQSILKELVNANIAHQVTTDTLEKHFIATMKLIEKLHSLLQSRTMSPEHMLPQPFNHGDHT